MKRMKKLASVILAMVMVLLLAVPAMAEEPTTGSITIKDSETVTVAGRTFNAYKILDVVSFTEEVKEGNTVVQKATVVYTVPENLKDFYKTRYGLTGTEGNFDFQVAEGVRKETDMFAFAADALAAAKAAGIAPGTATAGAGATSVTIGNLPLGYYVVEDKATEEPVSALILDTTKTTVEVNIKADKPDLDKVINGNSDTDDATTGPVKNNNASVGDSVPYVLTSKVPDMTGYTKYFFVVNDTLSKGLTFNNDVVITVGNKTLTKDTDYTLTSTVNADKTTSVKIVFKNFIQYKEQVGEDITITYSATINNDAVIGVEGNPNKATLVYSNNPNVEDDHEDEPGPQSPVGETPASITRTYVTGLELIKVDPNGKRLTGAEFQIEGTKLNTVLVRKDVFAVAADGEYWKLKDGSYTTDDPNAEGMDKSKYEDTATKYKKTVETKAITTAENVKYVGTVGADGVLRFEGLAAGEYTITELKAPNGYNLLKEPIVVTIGFTAPATPSTECTWTYKGTDLVNGTNINQITVVNQTGTELPSTGGIGTTIFYVLGTVLVLGAAILLITKKRMSAE